MKTSRKRQERGAVAIEYGLIAALIILALIPALQLVGGNTNGMWDRVSNRINTAMNIAR
jgi:pilus assembly protein Flp/PilA